MRVAIIGGTSVYELPGLNLKEEIVETPYGTAVAYWVEGGLDDFVFLPRHGLDHKTPPHKVNYRANIKALKMLGVENILATFAVGSINPNIPPGGVAVLSDFLDFTAGRDLTFYDGGDSGLAYMDMSLPYCPALSRRLLELAPEFDLNPQPQATYVCTNGPRFETPAEIRMYSKLGGDVVGMTGVPEVTLARELQMHYAAVAFSINWAVGINPGKVEIVREGIAQTRTNLVKLFIKTLQTSGEPDCRCKQALMISQPPKTD